MQGKPLPRSKTTSAAPNPPEGRREQKRRETLQRIADIGLKLFVTNGFEETTLDEIAEKAGISRRTFFYYFPSKEDVLMAWQGTGFVDAVYPALLEEPIDQTPMEAIRHCMLKLVSRYETKESIKVDKLLRSTEALRARKNAHYIEIEEKLFAALCARDPLKKERVALSLAAMTAVGVLRLSLEQWRADDGTHPLATYLKGSFSSLGRALE